MHFCKDSFWNIYLRMKKVLLETLNCTLIAAPGERCTSLSSPSPIAHCVLDQVQNTALYNNPIGKKNLKPKTNMEKALQEQALVQLLSQ